MKKSLFLMVGGMFTMASLSAQTVIHNPDGSTYKQCATFRVSEPLWKIMQDDRTPAEHFSKPKEAADEAAPSATYGEHYNKMASTVDPVIQTTQGTMQNAGTLQSFDGVSGQGYVPLDPNGMIGSNYYVQTINSMYAVWNKNGTAKLNNGDLKKLFGSWSCDNGDPVTMYDKFADRWIITEFQQNNSCSSSPNLIDTMMFAVSVTNDPTGKYYLYNFCPDNSDFADYPKYSIWSNGYYQTCNCQNDKVVVYDRTKMLAGDPTAGLISIPFNGNPWNSGGQGGFFCPMVLYADGQLPPSNSPNYLFYYNDDNWGSGFKDQIIIDKITVNWTNKTGSLTAYQTLATAAFNSYFSGGNRKDIDQPGQYQSFDALDGFFSYRIPYMRWASYNAAVMCNDVNVGTNSTSGSNIAGIRWYELRQDTTTQQWSIYQQGTYSPDQTSRWCPAIAMDENGSIGLEYTASAPTSVYPSLRYTGRTQCDPLGTMTLTEGIGAAGNTTASTSNRWGDYSHLSIDPTDGITFWGTGMYASTTSPYSSHVISHMFSFQIPKCSPTGVVNPSVVQAELKAYSSGGMLTVIGTKLPQGNNLYVQVFDLNGKQLITKAVMYSGSELQTRINVASLSSGIYFVRLGNDNFQRVVKVAIN